MLLLPLAGPAVHDHAHGSACPDSECHLDHGRVEGPHAAGDAATELVAADAWHHHCVGCFHSALRSVLAAPPIEASAPNSLGRAEASVHLEPRALRLWSGRHLRGPPAAS
ncbi:MAG: hypothetical protein AAF725_12825 [Acidobacteriota bacterium]